MTRAEKIRLSPRTVTELTDGKASKAKISKPVNLNSRINVYFFNKFSLEMSYLNQFLEDKFPNFPEINVLILLHAWNVVRDLADILAIPIEHIDRFDEKNYYDYALPVKISHLKDILRKALLLDMKIIDSIVDFFIFKPKTKNDRGHRGLWSAPIIPIPSSDIVGLPLAVLRTTNILRTVEAWLEKGGLDDSLSNGARGKRFEIDVRQKAEEQLIDNPIISDYAVLKQNVKPTATFREEIDLVFRIGANVFVCECKFFLFPAEPFEKHLYKKKMIAAAKQVYRKCAYFSENYSSLTGITEFLGSKVDLNFYPLIVTNQGHMFGSRIDGVPLTDSKFLHLVLGAGKFRSGMAFSAKKGISIDTEHIFYRGKNEAEKVFPNIFDNPFTIKRFFSRVEWINSAFPELPDKKIDVFYPFLGNYLDDERTQAILAAELIKGI